MKENRLIFLISAFIAYSLLYGIPAYSDKTSSFSKRITRPYMQDRESRYNQVQSEVESNLENWIENPDDGPWRTGNPKADILFEKDHEWLTDIHTETCNNSRLPQTHRHSYDDLHEGYKMEPKGCRVDFRYKGKGDVAGECIIILSLPPWCKKFEIHADLIDYYYATQKVNWSLEPFYSRYLSTEAIMNGKTNDSGGSNTSGNANSNQPSNNFGNSDNDTASILTLPQMLQNPAIGANYVRASINVFNSYRDTPAYTGAIPQVQVGTSPKYAWLKGANKSFGRLWGEKEIEEDYETYFPHTNIQMKPYSSEIDAWKLSYYLSETQEIDSKLFKRHGKNPEACARHDMATGKTPDYPSYIDSSWTDKKAKGSSAKEIYDMQCLTDIGPVVPYTAYRSPAVSDAFFQGIVKTLKAYYQKGRNGMGMNLESFTFRQDVDRLAFIPEHLSADQNQLNDELRQEIGKLNKSPETTTYNCTLLEDATHPNYEFDEINTVDIESRGETTVEVLTAFSGCWVIRGAPIIMRKRDSMFGPIELRLQ